MRVRINTVLNNQGTAVPKEIDKSMIYLAAGHYHNLALSIDGNVFSWGYNGFNNLGRNFGDSKTESQLNCLPMPVLSDFRAKSLRKLCKKKMHSVNVKKIVHTINQIKKERDIEF